jgi:hypothetical protein
MQLVVKTSDNGSNDASSLIHSLVLNSAPVLNEAVSVVVSKVFPKVTQGNRARLYTVNLPDDLSDETVQQVLTGLSKNQRLEYAERSAPKQPLGGE